MKKRIFLIVACLVIVTIFTKSNNKTYTSIINAKIFNDPTTTYIDRIDINYDTNKVRLSPAYTYSEAQHLFEYNLIKADGAHYHSGGNVYFYVCPTSSKCDPKTAEFVNSSGAYAEQVMKDKYHWLFFDFDTDDCYGEGLVCPYDFDKSNLSAIKTYLNGVEMTEAIVDDYYNEDWHSISVYVPIEMYTGPIVKDIEVVSDTSYVQRGTISNFTAVIDSYGEGANQVIWSISNNISSNTKINSSGVLTVDHDEESDHVVVRVTSAIDNTLYDEKYIALIDEPLSIDSVSFNRKSDVVVYGGSFIFSAVGNGTGSSDVTWSITGANSASTTIDEEGTLTVAADETATSITVTATSAFDNTKKANLAVTLRNTEIIDKIELFYDTDVVVFSTKSTYGALARSIEKNWHTKENAGYDEGNNNAWFSVCEGLERCTSGFEIINSDNYVRNQYTYVWLEIYSKPSNKENITNPLYDFDRDHLDQIEIWVNGVKRDDAYIGENDYYESWRMVHVNIPIEITDGKLTQYYEFYNKTKEVDYGDEPFTNSIYSYNRIGDGELSYTSSNPNVATVDNDGVVTPKNIGTCTITVTASETEDYLEYSNSYTVIVEPKYINPHISGVNSNYDYTGSQIKPSITVTYQDTPLIENTDYVVSYGTNVNTGTGIVYINPVAGSNYVFGENTHESFWINVVSITQEDITLSTNTVSIGGEPEVTIVINGRTLVKGTDYQLSYHDNMTAGTGYVRVTGIINYSGVVDVSFNVIEVAKGDMNKNGKIDLADIIILLKKYLNVDATEEEITIGDIDENGSIGLKDIIELLKLYLAS